MSKEPVINIEFHDVLITTNPVVEQDEGSHFCLSMGARLRNPSSGEFSEFVIKAISNTARGLLNHVEEGTIVNVKGHFHKEGFITTFMYGVGYAKPGLHVNTFA